jgi:hypothetical protein
MCHQLSCSEEMRLIDATGHIDAVKLLSFEMMHNKQQLLDKL